MRLNCCKVLFRMRYKRRFTWDINKLVMHVIIPRTGSANFSCKWPDGKDFRLCSHGWGSRENAEKGRPMQRCRIDLDTEDRRLELCAAGPLERTLVSSFYPLDPARHWSVVAPSHVTSVILPHWKCESQGSAKHTQGVAAHSSGTAIFNPCAPRIFKTCNTWLLFRSTNLFSLRSSN